MKIDKLISQWEEFKITFFYRILLCAYALTLLVTVIANAWQKQICHLPFESQRDALYVGIISIYA